MSKKYLDTKSGSLEEKISQIAKEQPTIKKPEPNVKLETKTYFGVKEGSLAAVAAKVVSEETEYQAKFKKELEKTGKSVAQMSDAEKKAFFNKMDTMHKAKNETHTWTKNVIYKKQKETGGEKEIIKPIKEGGMKDIATDRAELERLTKRVEDLRKNKKTASDENKDKIQKDILQTQKSVADLRLKMKSAPVVEKVDEPYAVGMAAAMKQTGDKPPLKKSTITKAHDIAKSIMQKQEEVSQKAINKFHTRLDKLVHKAFGHSSDEKQVKKENDEVPKGYHKMPDGKIMKNSEHKKESKSFKEVRQKMNAQKDTEKDLPAKGKTMTGQPLAKIDTEPKTKII
jgi:hypothetical protein